MTDLPPLRPSINTADFKRGVGEINQSLKSMQQSITSAGAGFKNFALSAASLAGVGLSLNKIVSEAGEAQRNMVRLTSLLKAQGLEADRTARAIKELADKMSSRTTFAGDAFVAASANLVRMGVASDKTLERLLALSAGLASASDRFGSVEAASLAVARALQNPGEGMRQLAAAGFGVGKSTEEAAKKLVEMGKASEAATLLIGELEKKVGDTADKMNTTLPGAISRAGNAFDDFAEAIGQQSNTNSSMIGFFEEFKKQISSSETLVKGLGDALSLAFDAATAAIKIVFDVLRPFGEALSFVTNIAKSLPEAIAKSLGVSVGALNDAVSQTYEQFKKFGQAALDFLSGTFGIIVNKIAQAFDYVIKQAVAIKNVISDLYGGEKTVYDGTEIQNFVNNWKDAYTEIAEAKPEVEKTAASLEGLNDRINELAVSSEDAAASAEKLAAAMRDGQELQDQIGLLQDELLAINQGKDAYDQYKQTLETFNDAKEYENKLRAAVKDGYKLDEKQIKDLVTQYKSLKGSISDATKEMEKSAERAQEIQAIYDDAATGIKNSFKDAFVNIFQTGDFSFRSLAKSVKSILINMAAEAASIRFAQPVINGLFGVGGGGGSGGVSASSLSAGGSSVAGGGGGFGLDSLGSIGQVGSLLSGANPFYTSTSLGGIFDSYNAIQAPAGAANAGSTIGYSMTGGSLGVSLGQAASIAGAGLSIYNFAKNPGIGSGLGLAGGAAGVLGAFGVINPVLGAVAAIALPLLGGLFKKRPSVGPNGLTQIDIIDGKLKVGSTGADNGADPKVTIDAANEITSTLNKFFDLYGLSLDNDPRGIGGNYNWQTKLSVGQGKAYDGPARSGEDVLKYLINNKLIKGDNKDALDLIYSGKPLTEVAETLDFRSSVDRAYRMAIEPQKVIMEEFEKSAKERIEQAKKFGADIVKVEKLIALDREKVIAQSGQAANSALKEWLNGQKLSSTSTLTPYEQLGIIQTQFDEAVTAARTQGNTTNLLSSAERLLGASQFVMGGATKDYATREAFVRSTIESIGRQLQLPGFAMGGEIKVTGSGGTDSEIIAMRVTPGETIKVSPPGANEGGSMQSVAVLQAELRALRGDIRAIADAMDKERTLNAVTRRSA